MFYDANAYTSGGYDSSGSAAAQVLESMLTNAISSPGAMNTPEDDYFLRQGTTFSHCVFFGNNFHENTPTTSSTPPGLIPADSIHDVGNGTTCSGLPFPGTGAQLLTRKRVI
jgi:hypothetical protein